MSFKFLSTFFFMIIWLPSVFSQESTESIEFSDFMYFMYFIKESKYQDAYPFFDEMFKSKVSLVKLEEVWNNVLVVNGQLNDYYLNCTDVENKIQYFTCIFEKQKIDMKIHYNEKQKILSFFLVPIQICSNTIKYKSPKYVKLS